MARGRRVVITTETAGFVRISVEGEREGPGAPGFCTSVLMIRPAVAARVAGVFRTPDIPLGGVGN